MNETSRKARVPVDAYQQASKVAESLDIVHGEFKAVVVNGKCVSLFSTHSLPMDKVELVQTTN
jgi:hypothetical protein